MINLTCLHHVSILCIPLLHIDLQTHFVGLFLLLCLLFCADAIRIQLRGGWFVDPVVSVWKCGSHLEWMKVQETPTSVCIVKWFEWSKVMTNKLYKSIPITELIMNCFMSSLIIWNFIIFTLNWVGSHHPSLVHLITHSHRQQGH